MTANNVWTKLGVAAAAHPLATVIIVVALALMVLVRSAADVVIRCNAERCKNQRYSMALEKATAEERAQIIRALESAPDPPAGHSTPSLRQRLWQFASRQPGPSKKD